jgi:Tfp pilus assembly protein FimT
MRKVMPRKRKTLLVVGAVLAVLAALGYPTLATASADTTASADN